MRGNFTAFGVGIALVVLAACTGQPSGTPAAPSPVMGTPSPVGKGTPTRGVEPTEQATPVGAVTFPPPTWIVSTPASEPTVAPTPIAIPMPLIGVESHNMTAEGYLYLLDQTKTQIVRRNAVLWNQVESTPGARNWFFLSNLEQELINLSSRGIQTIVIVRNTPAWAQKVPGALCGPIKRENFADFADFMSDLVTRYSQPPYSVKYWEIGNEPDVDAQIFVGSNAPFGCWGDKDDPYYGGGYYADMLKVVYPAIKAADPEAQVLLGGLLLDCDPTHPPEDKDCRSSNFFEGVLRQGGGAYFDIVSFHGYPFFFSKQGKLYFDKHFPGWESRGGVVLGKVDFLREVMAAYGVDKPIFHSEGALNCPEWNPGDCKPAGEAFFEAQADYVVWMLVRDWAAGVQASIWYQFEDKGWRYVGMVGPSVLEPHPAYRAYQFLTHKLDGAVYTGPVVEYPELRTFTFSKGDREIWVLWPPDDGTYVIYLPDQVVTVYDKYGQDITPADREMQVTSPIYADVTP